MLKHAGKSKCILTLPSAVCSNDTLPTNMSLGAFDSRGVRAASVRTTLRLFRPTAILHLRASPPTAHLFDSTFHPLRTAFPLFPLKSNRSLRAFCPAARAGSVRTTPMLCRPTALLLSRTLPLRSFRTCAPASAPPTAVATSASWVCVCPSV